MLHPADPSFTSTLRPAGGDRLLTFFAAIAIMTVLYVGRDVFVPIAVAVLLAFVLAPVILVLRKLGLPRTPSVVGVVLLTFIGLFALGAVMALQVTELVAELPQYRLNMREKVKSLREATAESGTLARTMDLLQDLGQELDGAVGPSGSAPRETGPLPVEIHERPPGTLGTLSAVMTPLLHPLASFGIVFIFVLFILLQREDLRNRFVRLAGAHDIQRTTAALDDAGTRLSRFFLAQVALNAGFGATIGMGLWLIGVPNPLLWGLAAAVLRFVPYVGAVIAAALPLGFALAVDPGWSMVLATALLFLVLEPLAGHVIEPLLYGRSTGLSPVAVIASATFWTWLWGPVGLILATPLTLCLVVMGRHVERLEFLDVALGDRPPLSASELLYQRLLAGDPLEAAAAAEDHLRGNSRADYCDTVAVPALRLAQRDAARGALDAGRQIRVRETLAEMLEHLPQATNPEGDADRAGPQVLVLAARTPLDEAAGLLIASLAQERGLRCEVHPAGTARRLPQVVAEAIVVLAYLSPATPAHRRYTVRRLRREGPGRPTAVVVTDLGGDGRDTARLEGEDAVAASCAEALKAISAPAGTPATAPAV